MGGFRKFVSITALVAAMAIVNVAPAHATVQTFSCSSGGFTGYLQLTDAYTNVDVYYKITKGTNTGGNHANVYVTDYGVLPTVSVSNNDDGIQDAQFHYLYGPYNRGSGEIAFKFIFDKSNAADPSCHSEVYPHN